MHARRLGLFLAWLLLCVAPAAWSTTTTEAATTTTVTTTTVTTTTVTTTTTSTTTTTLPPGAGLVRCTIDSDSVYVNGPYHVVGRCTMSPGYAEGGDAVGVGATLAQAGKALCNSPQRVPIVVLIEAAHPAPATTNWLLFDYEHSTRKFRAFDPKLGTEVDPGTDLSTYTLHFRADCK